MGQRWQDTCVNRAVHCHAKNIMKISSFLREIRDYFPSIEGIFLPFKKQLNIFH